MMAQWYFPRRQAANIISSVVCERHSPTTTISTFEGFLQIHEVTKQPQGRKHACSIDKIISAFTPINDASEIYVEAGSVVVNEDEEAKIGEGISAYDADADEECATGI